MSSHGYRMEYFRDAELLVDVTEHKLVPGDKFIFFYHQHLYPYLYNIDLCDGRVFMQNVV